MRAKERGMDGFQFEVCVNATVDEAPDEYDLKLLASLDDYPKDDMLIYKQRRLIGFPAKLDMWYYDIYVSDKTEGTEQTSRIATE